MHRRSAFSALVTSLLWASKSAAATSEPLEPSTRGFLDFAAMLLRDQLPPSYENWKKWGKTKEVFAGLKVEREGLKIETRPKKKTVNHGSWSMYRIERVDTTNPPDVTLNNLRDANGAIALDLLFRDRLNFFARHALWELGVQLWSIHLDADATVDLKLTCETKVKLDATKFPPDVILAPKVTSAVVGLQDFRINRVSKSDGPIVKSLSATLREIVEDEIAERNKEILDRINRQIVKNEAKLRFSAGDLAKSKWKAAEKFLPGKK
jgi:hypothetical protein